MSWLQLLIFLSPTLVLGLAALGLAGVAARNGRRELEPLAESLGLEVTAPTPGLLGSLRYRPAITGRLEGIDVLARRILRPRRRDVIGGGTSTVVFEIRLAPYLSTTFAAKREGRVSRAMRALGSTDLTVGDEQIDDFLHVSAMDPTDRVVLLDPKVQVALLVLLRGATFTFAKGELTVSRGSHDDSLGALEEGLRDVRRLCRALSARDLAAAHGSVWNV